MPVGSESEQICLLLELYLVRKLCRVLRRRVAADMNLGFAVILLSEFLISLDSNMRVYVEISDFLRVFCVYIYNRKRREIKSFLYNVVILVLALDAYVSIQVFVSQSIIERPS